MINNTDKIPDGSLSWEITSEEKRERTQKLLSVIAIPFVLMSAMGILFADTSSFSELLSTDALGSLLREVAFVVLIAIGAVLFLFVINKFWPYANRKYQIDAKGVTIWKGKRQKYFLWSELENYFIYKSLSSSRSTRDRLNEPTKKQVNLAAKNIEGEVFYLSKKPRNILLRIFYKTFAVIYTEPDNSQNVNNFISRHLPQRKMRSFDSLGLKSHYFK